MKNKVDALDMLKSFVTEIKNQISKKIKMFCSDIGTKYKYNSFNKVYKLCGIIHENTRYHPKMNGKVERKNKKITKLTIAIILNHSVASFWRGEILLNVYYVLKKKL